MSRFRSLYGAGPLNLLVLLLCFAIAGFAVMGWFQRPRDVVTVIEWFAAAIVLHDVVVVPLYTLVDRVVFGWLGRSGVGGGAGPARRGGGRGPTVLGAVNSTPYLRVPTILSGLLLVVFFPVIFGLGSQTEFSASGIRESGYLARWLIASGVIFAVSGAAWGVAVGRGRGRGRAVASRGPGPAVPRAATDPPPGPEPDPAEPGPAAPGAATAPPPALEPDPTALPDEATVPPAHDPEPTAPADAAPPSGEPDPLGDTTPPPPPYPDPAAPGDDDAPSDDDAPPPPRI